MIIRSLRLKNTYSSTIDIKYDIYTMYPKIFSL